MQYLKKFGYIDNGWNTGGNGITYMMGWQLKKEYFEPDFIGMNQSDFDIFWSNIKDETIYTYSGITLKEGINTASVKEVYLHVEDYIKEQFRFTEFKDQRDLWYNYSKSQL